MNISGIILLSAGYLLGNPEARDKFGTALQQLIGHGVDALNSIGGEANAPNADVDGKPGTE